MGNENKLWLVKVFIMVWRSILFDNVINDFSNEIKDFYINESKLIKIEWLFQVSLVSVFPYFSCFQIACFSDFYGT